MSEYTLEPKLNKPKKEGYTYRSPEQTSAKSLLPHPKENAARSLRADIDRIKRGLDASGSTPQARRAQQDNAGAATSRTLGRAGYAGAALTAGEEIGKGIERAAPGTGKAIVDKTVGPIIDRIYGKSGVKLTPEAKRRIEAGELDQLENEAETKRPSKPRRARSEDSGSPESRLEESRNYNVGDDTRRRAMAAVRGSDTLDDTEDGYRRGGKVKKYAKGGSVSSTSSASRRGDGIAQRGKTKGRMY